MTTEALDDARLAFADVLCGASEADAQAAILQFFYDAMDACEQSELEEAIIAASDAFEAKIAK
jgi:hypothetical protein